MGGETVKCRKRRIGQFFSIADKMDFRDFDTDNAEFAEYIRNWSFSCVFCAEFAEKWGIFGLSQKFCQNFCGLQNLPKDNTELAKR